MTLLQVLGKVKDHRTMTGRKYELKYVLLFSILAIMCGAKTYAGIADWISSKFHILKPLFGLRWKQPIGRSRIQDICSKLNVESLENAFRLFSQEISNPYNYPILAIDGKSLRGSYDKLNDILPANLLSVFNSDSNLILAHIEIPNKESEMIHAQELIEQLGIYGTLTLDALHTQKKP
jgi:hypothetical protein